MTDVVCREAEPRLGLFTSSVEGGFILQPGHAP